MATHDTTAAQTERPGYIPLPEPEEGVTKQIIGAAFEVHNVLGAGLLEALYEKALMIELESRGLSVQRQVRGSMIYKGQDIGQFTADLVVAGSVVVELKSAEAIAEGHVRQVLNYTRMLNMRAGLVINFGPPRVGVRRVLNTGLEKQRS